MSDDGSQTGAPTLTGDVRYDWLALAYPLSVPFLGALAFNEPGFITGMIAVGFWLVVYSHRNRVLGVTMACGLMLLGWLIWNLQPPIAGRETAALHTRCKDNLKQLMLAMHIYHDVHETFPPPIVRSEKGEPPHSWRTLLLPHLGHGDVYDEYDFSQPWNSPHNQQVTAKLGDDNPYHCPSDPAAELHTRYFLVTGERTATLPDRGRAIKEISEFGLDSLGDGTRNTIMMIEAHDHQAHWAEPIDLTLAEALDELTSASSLHHGRADRAEFYTRPSIRNVALPDGGAQSVPNILNRDTWRSLLIIDDGGPEFATLDLSIDEYRRPILWRWAAAGMFAVLVVLPLPFVWWTLYRACGDVEHRSGDG